MSWIKKITWLFLYFIYIFVSVFLLLEIFFRFLPVSDSLEVMSVNEDNPIIHFQPNRTVTRQIGFNFNHVNEKRINNFGYATDIDFKATKPKESKVVAVIGDSYVEALQVANQDSFHGLIQHNIDDLVLYPISMSGSPLSQYLAFINFASINFDPDIYLLVLIDNDFDRSWEMIQGSHGFHYFTKNGHIERKDYQPSLIKHILRKSAFVRYLYLDLKITTQAKLIMNRIFGKEEDRYYININLNNRRFFRDQKEKDKVESLGHKAAELFLEQIEKISLDKEVIVLLDGDRESIYSNRSERDKGMLSNRWFNTIIRNLEHHQRIKLVDMHPIFLNDWQLNSKKFNYDYDFHWNEHGHSVVAKTLTSTLKEIQDKSE